MESLVIRSGWSRLGGNVRGAVWMLFSALFMAVQSAIVKSLGESMHSLEIVFFRGMIGVLLVLPFLVRRGRLRITTRRPRLHFARAMAGLVAMACGFYAVTKLTLADATAIAFTMPLFMILLAVLMLGEVVGWRRWTATVIGFVGVLVVVRPGMAAFQWASLIALAGALSHALVGVTLKKLSETETVALTMFYFSMYAAAVFLIPAILFWKTPTPYELGLLLVMASLGMMNQVAFFRAAFVGEMTAVVPFDYSRLLFAGILGYLVFAEVPDGWTVVGAAVIVGSTLFIARREAKLARIAAMREAGHPPGSDGLR